jgi:tetratricopeptide (TPR) repeat protein
VGTKEVIVTAPLMVLLYDRVLVSGSFRNAWRRHPWVYVGLAACWLPIGLQMSVIGHQAAGFGHGVAWWDYALTECRAVVMYLRLCFWPHPLVLDYGMFKSVPPAELAPYAAIVVALLAMVGIAFRFSPVAGFAASWFFVTLAPTSSIVPLPGQPMAEHRLYLPLAGVVALAVLGAYALAGRRSFIGVAAVAPVLMVLSFDRNRDYGTEESIVSDTLAKNPSSARAHFAVANFLSHVSGRSSDAIVHYEEALKLAPGFADAHRNLGDELAKIPGRLNDAVAQYEDALKLRPDSPATLTNLGNALRNIPGRSKEAIAQYQAALHLRPDYAVAHNNLGLVWSTTPDRSNDAIVQFEEALRADPDYAVAHCNLGDALAKIPGRSDEAAAQYREALRLKPDYVEAHNNLGSLWANQPAQLDEAIAQFETAVGLSPGSAAIHYNLAAALLKAHRRRDDAVAHLETALRLDPGNETVRRLLAQLNTP